MISHEIFLSFIRGDRKAFEYVYSTYVSRVYHFVYSLIKEQEVAKDITQDIFIQLWNKRENINPDENVEGYIFKVSKYSVYHYTRRRLLMQDYANQLEEEDNDGAVDIEDDWNTGIDSRAFEEKVYHLLQNLPETRRKIFMLYWKSGKNYREIANEMSISEKTVATQVRRSLIFLRDHLDSLSLAGILFMHTLYS